MTVETRNPDGSPVVYSGPYSGNGSTTIFDYDFKILADTELTVTAKNTSTGVETVQTLNTDYTVTGVGNNTGGTVVFTTAPATGTSIVIDYDGDFNQSTQWSNQAVLNLSALEDTLDKTMMHLRQLRRFTDRAVLSSPFSTATLQLPTLTANAVLAVNSTGDGLVNGPGVDTISAAITSAAEAATSATNAATSATAAAASAAAAATFDPANFQPIDAALTSLSGLTLSSGKMLYATAADTLATFDSTAYGRALLSTTDAAALIAAAGLGDLAGDSLATYTLSDATWTAGTSTSQGMPTPAQVKAAIDATSNPVMIVQDQKPTNTPGGTSVSGTQTRTLNTVVANSITGASLASNQVTLPAGTYKVVAAVPAGSTPSVSSSANNQAWLYNVTGSFAECIGSAAFCYNSSTLSVIEGYFTTASTTVLEIQHYIANAVTNAGLGNGVNSGEVNVFTTVYFEKVA